MTNSCALKPDGDSLYESEISTYREIANVMELQTISDYSEYMEYLFGMKSGRDIYFAVNGGGSNVFQIENKEQIEKLKKIGIEYYPKADESGDAYIGIVKNGESVYEMKSENIAEHYYCNTDEKDIKIKSISAAPTDYGTSVASITINGEEFSVNRDGFNLVIYDQKTQCVIDSVAVFQGEDGNLTLSHRPGSDLIGKYKRALYNIDMGLPL